MEIEYLFSSSEKFVFIKGNMVDFIMMISKYNKKFYRSGERKGK
jgi:hypothetical protein